MRTTRGWAMAVLLALISWPLAAGAEQSKPAKAAPPRDATRSPQPPKPPKPASREPGRPDSFDVSVSGRFAGPVALGARDATLSANQLGSSQRFTLFRASADLGGSPGVAATVGYHWTRTVAIEAGFGYSAPPVRVTVSGDVENGAGAGFDGERLSEYLVEGSLVAHIGRLAFAGGRGRPFLMAGAGYRRQLHDGNFAIDTGQVYHAGGGVKYMFKPRARGMVRAFGLRADGRVSFGVGGFSFDDRTTTAFVIGAGILAAF